MRVLMVNGSPHKRGVTKKALEVVAERLETAGVEVCWFELGSKPVRGCVSCGRCGRNNSRCVFEDDAANDLIEAIVAADGVVVGTPTYFAGANGALLALMDRAFFAANEHGRHFVGKPAAAIATEWRAGAVSACDDINRYFLHAGMPIVASNYWPVRFGSEVDSYGDRMLSILGDRMAKALSLLDISAGQ